jgi:Tetratricopeptide repeat
VTAPPPGPSVKPLLDRWRSSVGADHPDTLTAASALPLALAKLGEAEPARALAEDTLQRSRRVLGSDHPTTLQVATGLTLAPTQLGAAGAARALAEDTLQRCRRVLGPDHPTTLYPTQVIAGGHPVPGGDAAADRPDRPL